MYKPLALASPVGNQSSSGPAFPLNFHSLGAQKELTPSSEVLLHSCSQGASPPTWVWDVWDVEQAQGQGQGEQHCPWSVASQGLPVTEIGLGSKTSPSELPGDHSGETFLNL